METLSKLTSPRRPLWRDAAGRIISLEGPLFFVVALAFTYLVHLELALIPRLLMVAGALLLVEVTWSWFTRLVRDRANGTPR